MSHVKAMLWMSDWVDVCEWKQRANISIKKFTNRKSPWPRGSNLFNIIFIVLSS